MKSMARESRLWSAGAIALGGVRRALGRGHRQGEAEGERNGVEPGMGSRGKPTLWGVIAYLLLPYAVLSLVWRGLRYRAYWHRWPERFGYVERPAAERVIWVHAVSVGEVRSCIPLVNALAERFPDHRILVTTMTPTGSQQVQDLFADRVSHAYVPYDFPGAVHRFLDRTSPRFAVIAETEFWPNIFSACRRRGIPLLLVNVRVSPAAFRGYSRVPRTIRLMLANADVICAQTRADLHRLSALGADEQHVHVTGNLKFDVDVPAKLLEEGAALRASWGRHRPVLIAASTHRGEETQILAGFARLRHEHPDMLLVLVPRHPERFGTVARLCRRAGYRIALRSDTRGSLPEQTAILVGDTMGEVQRLYAASDVAFIGGSLVPKGGQNLLEACAVGVPVLFGPYMFHFEEISTMALESGAGRRVHDAEDLAREVTLYMEQPSLKRTAGEAARRLVADNRGALDRTLELMMGALRARSD
jgi:3-deoxy-D-manno-octulosonic-acid transferase